MATCMLCGSTGKGNVRGHIVPAWAYDMTTLFDKTFHLGIKEEGYDSPHIFEEINRSKARITANMFCGKNFKGCDQIIGDGEAEIKRVFVDASVHSFTTISGNFPYKVIKPEKFRLLTRGIAGIILKGYLSKKFRPTEHFSKDNFHMIEFLKRAILDDNLSSKAFKITVIKSCSDISPDGLGIQTAGHIHIQPFPKEKIFSLTFGGITLNTFIDESSVLIEDEIPVFAEHYATVREHAFVALANNLYTRRYPATSEELFTYDYGNIYVDRKYFNLIANPESHILLTEKWLAENSLSKRCFCGNLSKTKRARIRGECCGKFWLI